MTPDFNTPPPLPDDYQQRPSYGKKVFLMGCICCALMLGVLAVWLMSDSRESTNVIVVDEIALKWGKNVSIDGPTIKEIPDSAIWQRPLTFDCKAKVESQSLHRGIYEAEVFTSNVKMSGVFNRNTLTQCDGDSVIIKLGVTTKQIEKPSYLTISGKKMEWSYSDYALICKVNIADMPQQIEYSTEFNVRGSGALFIKPIGERSSVTINGEASNPSFSGASLPVARNVSDNRFYASWEESAPAGVKIENSHFVGTSFLVGVDRYQKVTRSMKYSFIIIVLTFISVLFVEIIKKHPIPLLNYFLIGAALIIFYSLLLSFAEIISFGYAYLVASAMTIALITGYIWKMLDSRNLGSAIGAVLTVMYLFCYIMLCISTYALLIGSLLLFFALAAMMYGSLKIKR